MKHLDDLIELEQFKDEVLESYIKALKDKNDTCPTVFIRIRKPDGTKGHTLCIPSVDLFKAPMGREIFRAAIDKAIDKIKAKGEYEVVYLVFASEVFFAKVTKEEGERMMNTGQYIHPSEVPDRTEALILTVETITEQDTVIYEIKRDNHKNVTSVDMIEMAGIDKGFARGMFSNFLFHPEVRSMSDQKAYDYIKDLYKEQKNG